MLFLDLILIFLLYLFLVEFFSLLQVFLVLLFLVLFFHFQVFFFQVFFFQVFAVLIFLLLVWFFIDLYIFFDFSNFNSRYNSIPANIVRRTSISLFFILQILKHARVYSYSEIIGFIGSEWHYIAGQCPAVKVSCDIEAGIWHLFGVEIIRSGSAELPVLS